MSRSRLFAVAFGSFAFALAGCGAGGGKSVSASDFGGDWPLLVDEGTLDCDGGAVTFESEDGTTYAVNGTAMTVKPELPDIGEIWADDPDTSGLKKSMILIDEGLEICQ